MQLMCVGLQYYITVHGDYYLAYTTWSSLAPNGSSLMNRSISLAVANWVGYMHPQFGYGGGATVTLRHVYTCLYICIYTHKHV